MQRSSAPIPSLSIPSSRVSGSQGEERIPVRGLRRKIVEAMRRSVDHAAHFTHMDELDATKLVEIRESLKEEAAKYGVKLNYLPFVVKATAMALKQHPRLNGSLDEEKSEIVIKKDINLGVAVATKEEDLIVPVIQHADQKNLLEIASEIKSLAEKAQSGKLSPADLQGGTFTITSLGPLAGTYATPIINYPEVAILGFFAIKERPVIYQGEIAIRHMSNLAVSCDHRVVDGALCAKFTKTLISFLENPESMLLFS
jgi:pyruvate dehydrogenase E2 component (dihydrolipoamide acetyltransferase)